MISRTTFPPFPPVAAFDTLRPDGFPKEVVARLAVLGLLADYHNPERLAEAHDALADADGVNAVTKIFADPKADWLNVPEGTQRAVVIEHVAAAVYDIQQNKPAMEVETLPPLPAKELPKGVQIAVSKTRLVVVATGKDTVTFHLVQKGETVASIETTREQVDSLYQGGSFEVPPYTFKPAKAGVLISHADTDQEDWLLEPHKLYQALQPVGDDVSDVDLLGQEFSMLRQVMTRTLQAVRPDAYKKYRQLKDSGEDDAKAKAYTYVFGLYAKIIENTPKTAETE